MQHHILTQNEKRRLSLPLWMLLCFSAFCAWQMGFIYFTGTALVIHDRTPLPINADNMTVIIAVAYVLSIILMSALPQWVIRLQRICIVATLLMVVGLFLPLEDDTLRLLVYGQCFFCCVMIGFETFTIVNYFTEDSAIRHLTAAYGAAFLVIAAVQNDFFPVGYPLFRMVTVLLLLMLLLFFFRMPAGRDACSQYVTKRDSITAPRKLLLGTFFLVFVSALMAVSGPSVAGEAAHGVFICYAADAAASFLMYALYKKAAVHPFRCVSAFLSMGCVGFLLMYVSAYIPALSVPACALIGVGMFPCQMLPLYNLVLMKSYPSRWFAPLTIALALVAVLVQSSLVEAFRNTSYLLCLVYTVIMVILSVIYLQTAPYFFRRANTSEKEAHAEHPLLATLTKREREVLELIGGGYSNRDIAQMLYISEHTVNDYTKKIYRKLEVHSRHAAARIINRSK